MCRGHIKNVTIFGDQVDRKIMSSTTMRSVRERQLRRVVAKAYKKGGFRGDTQMGLDGDLIFAGTRIPKNAKMFFPPVGSIRRTKVRSLSRAVIYVDDRGSTINVYPEKVEKRINKADRRASRFGIPAVGVKISSFV